MTVSNMPTWNPAALHKEERKTGMGEEREMEVGKVETEISPDIQITLEAVTM